MPMLARPMKVPTERRILRLRNRFNLQEGAIAYRLDTDRLLG